MDAIYSWEPSFIANVNAALQSLSFIEQRRIHRYPIREYWLVCEISSIKFTSGFDEWSAKVRPTGHCLRWQFWKRLLTSDWHSYRVNWWEVYNIQLRLTQKPSGESHLFPDANPLMTYFKNCEEWSCFKTANKGYIGWEFTQSLWRSTNQSTSRGYAADWDRQSECATGLDWG